MRRSGIRSRAMLLLLGGMSACATHLSRHPGIEVTLSNNKGGGATEDLGAARASLLSADRAFARAAADTHLVEALAAPMADDGIFLAPGNNVRGAAEVRRLLSGNPGNLKSRWRWFPIRGDVSNDGLHGYTVGYTELVLPNGSVLPGKYQAYWVRTSTTPWRIAAYKRTPRAAGQIDTVPPAGFRTPTAGGERWVSGDTLVALRAVFATDSAFSASAAHGLADAFATFAAPNGMQTGTGASWAFGPEAIRQALAGSAPGLSWRPEIGRVARSGDLAFSIGPAFREGSPIGSYLSFWQKQRSGNWLYVVD